RAIGAPILRSEGASGLKTQLLLLWSRPRYNCYPVVDRVPLCWLGPRSICHARPRCWRDFNGFNQPCSTKIPAVAIAFLRSRRPPGANCMMFLVVMVVPGQRFTSHSNIFSVGVDLGSLKGTTGRNSGPRGIATVGSCFPPCRGDPLLNLSNRF